MGSSKTNAEIQLEIELKKRWVEFNSAKSQSEAQEKMAQALSVYRTLKKQIELNK